MNPDFLDNLQEKNPRIIAEYLFENYEHNEVNKLVKQIQKKIIEKNNSLKLMLSHRYVDLLDCSELIENLKHYSLQMSGIAERNAGNIKNSLDFISEKKSAPVKLTQPKKISNIEKCIQLQSKALEITNREVELNSLTEKIYFVILFLVNTQKIHQNFENDSQKTNRYREYVQNVQHLKELLCESFARLISSLDQIVTATFIFEQQTLTTYVLGVLRSIQYIVQDEYCRGILPDILEDLLSLPQDLAREYSFTNILRFSFQLSIKTLEKRLEETRNTPNIKLKNFLKVIRDFLFLLSEESDGFIIKKVDDSLQSHVLSLIVFRALNEEENNKIQRISEIFDLGYGIIVKEAHQSFLEFLDGVIPTVEHLIRSNSKTESKFHSDFMFEILWEEEQKQLLETLRTRYGLELPQKIEEAFRDEWNNFSEFYIKKIIEDFNIEDSLQHIIKSMSPFMKNKNNMYPKVLNGMKLNSELNEAVQLAEINWRLSINQYDEFWGTFEKNAFQSSDELDHLEKIITEALMKKVIEIDEAFRRIFFENFYDNKKKYLLFVILINFLELAYQTLMTITLDLKKKDLFVKLLESLCERMYHSIENDMIELIKSNISSSNNEEKQDSPQLLKILRKINKKILQFQIENITNPKYIPRFKEKLKLETQKLVHLKSGIFNQFSISKASPGSTQPSTYPLSFYYLLENSEIEEITKFQLTEEKKSKKEVTNVRDTLFLDKLSADPNEFLNDYTVIPIQKFTLRKKAESMMTKKEKKIDSGETSRRTTAEENIAKQLQFAITPENIDQIAEKAKNIVGGVFKLFKQNN